MFCLPTDQCPFYENMQPSFSGGRRQNGQGTVVTGGEGQCAARSHRCRCGGFVGAGGHGRNWGSDQHGRGGHQGYSYIVVLSDGQIDLNRIPVLLVSISITMCRALFIVCCGYQRQELKSI